MSAWYPQQPLNCVQPRIPRSEYSYRWPTPVDPGQENINFSAPHVAPPPQQPAPITQETCAPGAQSTVNSTAQDSKWKFGIAGYTVLSIVVLAINVLFTIWVTTRPRSDGISSLYVGSCSVSSQVAVWVHLAINILSFILTKASSDCMQKVLAPARDDIDRAHSQGSWLDVGVASLKNFSAAKTRCKFAYILLGLSSIPLSVVYNSTVFSGQFGNSYNYKVMGMKYLSQATRGNAPSYITDFVPDWALGYTSFENLSNAGCIREYASINIRGRDNVILITSREDDNLYVNPVQGQSGPWQAINYGSGLPSWMCASSSDDFGNVEALFYLLDFCPAGTTVDSFLATYATNWTIGGYPIAYCLSHTAPEKCEVQASLMFLLVVMVCNILKVVGMFMTLATRRKDQPLFAIGDAIASFLGKPDQNTEGSCLLTVEDVRRKDRGAWGARVWNSRKKSWWQAAGFSKFVGCLGLLSISLIFLIVLLTRAVHTLRSYEQTSSIWSLSGRANTFRDTWTLPSTTGYSAHAIVANLPQLLVTLLSLSYGNVVTIMTINNELASYSQVRHPLTTTKPHGQQRKTSLLSPSPAYAIPMMALFIVLHWLVSQSIYLVSGKTIHNKAFNPLDTYSDLMGLGFSPLAILLSMVLVLVLLVALAICGFRRYPRNAPFVGTNTFAIAAACHPPAGDINAATGELMWGALENDMVSSNYGHCSLTTRFVTAPVEGRLYGGIR